ncbi:MAG: ATP-dependent helicase RhlE [Labilithrix sp.]|nr:ATP-dependent helicase RhlE [Labilithrix sp.]
MNHSTPSRPSREARPAPPQSTPSTQSAQSAPHHVAPHADLPTSDAFAALGLSKPLLQALAHEGYVTPTPIQQRCIPDVLKGKDLLGCAQTGTGKTAAFVLPLLQNLASRTRSGKIRALVLAPTRELAAQISERTSAYGRNLGLTNTVIYGGVGQRNQEDALRKKPDILIATPGRLLDLMEQGYVKLDGVEVFILDEADRMLDMGFIHDVKRIVREVPAKRQTLFFSATMPPVIAELAGRILIDPVRVEVVPQATTAEKIEQTVHHVTKRDKRALLEKVLKAPGVDRALVFTRTKHGANRLVEQLDRAGVVSAAIHGNKSQGARERALDGFKDGSIPVLIATDIAARGIDVDGITHVVNYDLPNVPEQYVHRIGRTARAGARGRAIAFCDEEERGLLKDIERVIRQRIPLAEAIALPPPSPLDDAPRPPRSSGGGGGGGHRGQRPQGGGGYPRPQQGQQQRAPQRTDRARTGSPSGDTRVAGPTSQETQSRGGAPRGRPRRSGGGGGGSRGGQTSTGS